MCLICLEEFLVSLNPEEFLDTHLPKEWNLTFVRSRKSQVRHLGEVFAIVVPTDVIDHLLMYVRLITFGAVALEVVGSILHFVFLPFALGRKK